MPQKRRVPKTTPLPESKYAQVLELDPKNHTAQKGRKRVIEARASIEKKKVAMQAEADKAKKASQAKVEVKKTKSADKFNSTLAKAQKEFDKQDYTEALELAREALKLNPDSQEAVSLKLKSEMQIQKAKDANQKATVAANREQEDMKMSGMLATEAKSQMEKGDFVAAQTSIDKALALNPNNRAAKKLQSKLISDQSEAREVTVNKKINDAKSLIKSEKFDLAIERLEEALAIDPTNKTAKRYMDKAKGGASNAASTMQQQRSDYQRAKADKLFQEALGANDRGDLPRRSRINQSSARY